MESLSEHCPLFAQIRSDCPRTIWFDDLKSPLKLEAAEQAALVKFTIAVLLDRDRPEALPEIFEQDSQPRLVLISMSNGEGTANTILSAGNGIIEAIETARSRVQNSFYLKWLKLDLVQTVTPIDKLDFKLDRQWFGLAFDRETGLASLPEQLAIYGMTERDRLNGLLKDKNIQKYRFETSSWFSNQQTILPLYRGHAWFNQISAQSLYVSAVWAGEYLKGAIQSNGRFNYLYHADRDAVSNQYNILRHAGTLYALLELYEITRDTELLNAAKRAIAYLLEFIRPDRDMAGVVENDYIKLGGNALAIVALTKFVQVTGETERLATAIQLGRWIQTAQAENGQFTIHKQGYPGGEITDFVSGYYPGEAILALNRLYDRDGDETWLDTAESAALYLIQTRDGDLSDRELTLDHWLLYGLNELYRHRPNPVYLQHVTRIASEIARRQIRKSKFPDWRGGFDKPPRSTPTACKTEGLCAAYRLIRDFGEAQPTREILSAIGSGLRFQLQTQIRPELALHFPNPQRTLGGFRNKFSEFDVRIDFVQHNLSGLLAAYQIAREIGDRAQT